MLLDGTSAKRKIEEVAANLQDRRLPVIHENAEVKEIVEGMIRFGHSRILYVVDDEGRLLGTISLGALVRHVFSRSHEPRIHPRRLISAITMEKARHMMQKHPVFARKGEEIKIVLERMIQSNVKEIAIIDDGRRIVGDVTMLDLLEFLLTEKGNQ